MYSMCGSNIPENRLHETVDYLLAGLDQLLRRLSVDLSEGRRMSSNESIATSILISYGFYFLRHEIDFFGPKWHLLRS
jgi:hypothetical protein